MSVVRRVARGPRFIEVAQSLGVLGNLFYSRDFFERPGGYKTFTGTGTGAFGGQSFKVPGSAAFDAYHKDNAAFTILTLVKLDRLTGGGLCGNRAGAVSNIGFDWGVTSTPNQIFAVSNGSGVVVNQTSSGLGMTANTWMLLGISLTEATGANGILWQMNATFDNADTSTYASPSASAATVQEVDIGGRGGTVDRITPGTKMAGIGFFSAALTQQQMTDFYTAILPRLRD